MSVDDILYTLCNPEAYTFMIDGIEYGKMGDVPPDILIRNVNSWESITNDKYDYSYSLEIYTWNYFQEQIISGLELVCFNDAQLNAMVKSGTSLSNITDMTLTMDAMKALYSEQGFNKHNVRPLIYDYYANRLVELLNGFIIGKEDSK